MRSLIYVPIVHCEGDANSRVNEEGAMHLEASVSDRRVWRASAIESMWSGIRARLHALPLAWDQVKIYQDSLPICGHEEEITRQIAASGSRNHLLLLELMDKGATLMGTEDPSLLEREYRRINEIRRAAREGAAWDRFQAIGRERDQILELRDAFIARRIDATLEQDETAILLLRLVHRVDELIEGKFSVQHVIRRLPLGADISRRLEEVSRPGN